MTPFVLGTTFFLGILILALPRKYSFIPLFLGTCYITLGQRLMIGPLDFTVFRLLVSFGWIRVLFRREFIAGGLNKIDRTFIVWTILLIVTGTLQLKNMEGFINRCGYAYDAVGLYFLFRFLITDISEMKIVFKAIAIIFIPLVVSMIIEKKTGRNFFSIFGGVPDFSLIREGRIRCQGPFGHAILAGTAAATSIPMMLSLWWQDKKSKKFAIIGVISCLIIIVLSTSSGPILTLFMVSVGMTAWFYRRNMRLIRWQIFLSIIFLHIVMNDPVWFLMAKIDLAGGSTGDHRALLINSAIKYFDEWWFYGTNYTRHWMVFGVSWSPDHCDITNYYIKMGVLGGMALMIFFILIIIQGYKGVGKALYFSNYEPFKTKIIIWSLGAILFGHTMTFFAVSYFDQIVVFWYLLLALISTVSNVYTTPVPDELSEV